MATKSPGNRPYFGPIRGNLLQGGGRRPGPGLFFATDRGNNPVKFYNSGYWYFYILKIRVFAVYCSGYLLPGVLFQIEAAHNSGGESGGPYYINPARQNSGGRY